MEALIPFFCNGLIIRI